MINLALHYLRGGSSGTSCSKEVQLVVEWHNIFFTLIRHLNCFFSAFLRVLLRTFLGGSDCHVELCDLVSVLTGRWNFDRTGPVEVEMTKCKSQMLDIKLWKTWVVLRHEEMSGQNTTLGSWCRSEEKIKLLAFSSLVFDETFVDNASTRRIG